LEGDDSFALTNTLEILNRVHLKLAIFGSKHVISALSEYHSVEDVELTDRRRDAYVKMLRAMRNDGFEEQYSSFGADVDNIMLRGPIERRKRIHERLTAQQTGEDQ